MAKGEVIDKDMGFDELRRVLKGLPAESEVLIGIQGKTHSDMVVIAASNEYGTDTVPERSFLRSTVDDRAAEIIDDLTGAVKAALDGHDLDTELGRVGEKYVGKVRARIVDLKDPPNAPSTIKRKGSSNPLIATSRLKGSITYRIDHGDDP